MCCRNSFMCVLIVQIERKQFPFNFKFSSSMTVTPMVPSFSLIEMFKKYFVATFSKVYLPPFLVSAHRKSTCNVVLSSRSTDLPALARNWTHNSLDQFTFGSINQHCCPLLTWPMRWLIDPKMTNSMSGHSKQNKNVEICVIKRK